MVTHEGNTSGDESNDEYEAPGEYFEAPEKGKEEYIRSDEDLHIAGGGG